LWVRDDILIFIFLSSMHYAFYVPVTLFSKTIQRWRSLFACCLTAQQHTRAITLITVPDNVKYLKVACIDASQKNYFKLVTKGLLQTWRSLILVDVFRPDVNSIFAGIQVFILMTIWSHFYWFFHWGSNFVWKNLTECEL